MIILILIIIRGPMYNIERIKWRDKRNLHARVLLEDCALCLLLSSPCLSQSLFSLLPSWREHSWYSFLLFSLLSFSFFSFFIFFYFLLFLPFFLLFFLFFLVSFLFLLIMSRDLHLRQSRDGRAVWLLLRRRGLRQCHH